MVHSKIIFSDYEDLRIVEGISGIEAFQFKDYVIIKMDLALNKEDEPTVLALMGIPKEK